MKYLKTKFAAILIMICFIGYGQDDIVDSLKQVLKIARHDTVKLRILVELSENCEPTDILKYAQPAVELADKLLLQVTKIKRNIVLKQKAAALNSIGYIYNAQCDIPKALEYYGKSLKIREEIEDKQGIANSFINIGCIYDDQGDIPKGLEYYGKSLKICIEIGDKKGMAYAYNNIGQLYKDQGDITKALEYLGKGLIIFDEIEDKQGMAMSFNNIAIIYNTQGDISKTLEFHNKSLKIREEINDKQGMAISLNNIGVFYLNQNNLAKANNYAEKSYTLSKEIGYPENIMDAASLLKKVNEKQGNHKKAYEYYQEEMLMRDSMVNEESFKKTQKQQAKYEYEKMAATDSIAHIKAIEIKNIEVKKQKIVNWFVLCGLLLVMIIAVIIFRSLRITSRQKQTIESQKHEIEAQRDLVSQQKEHIEHIYEEQTDSIRYAERIQKAVLPGSESARAILGEHFILFKPKDIVSGDFYFVEKRKNILLIAVADCTGHGVPGAFMSMLGISFLNEIISKEEIQTAGQVLDDLRQYVIQSLQQKGIQGEQQDGMDIGFCVININTLEMQFAGANNPCYVIARTQSVIAREELTEAISDNEKIASPAVRNDEPQLIELKPDKQPIGIYANMQPFTNQIYQLQKGDTIYLMSDGYEDQFGGPNRKKFLSKNLKNLLIANSQLPMANKKQILESTISDWIGNGEQIDDITVLGIKI